MYNVVAVQVVHAFQGLDKEPECLGFCEETFGVLVVEEVAALRVLHHHVNHPFLHQRVPQSDEVRVVHLAVQVNLSFDQFGFSF